MTNPAEPCAVAAAHVSVAACVHGALRCRKLSGGLQSAKGRPMLAAPEHCVPRQQGALVLGVTACLPNFALHVWGLPQRAIVSTLGPCLALLASRFSA